MCAGKLCLHLVAQCGGLAGRIHQNPKGFGENELTDEDRQNLAWAEDARRKLVDAVDTLRGKVKGGNAEQISRAVYFCLKELGAEEQQAGLVEDIRAARGIPAAGGSRPRVERGDAAAQRDGPPAGRARV